MPLLSSNMLTRSLRLSLFRATGEAARTHLDAKQRAAASNVQRSLVGAAEREILTSPRDAPGRNGAEMLAPRAHHLDAGLGQRVDAAVVIDGKTIRAGDRIRIRGNAPIPADVGRKHAPIRQPAVGKHVERVRVNATGVVDVERLLVAAQLHPVRARDVIGNSYRRAARRDVIHRRRHPTRRGRPLREVAEVDAAFAIGHDVVGSAERTPLEAVGKNGLLPRRPDDAGARISGLRLQRDQSALRIERHPERALEVADEGAHLIVVAEPDDATRLRLGKHEPDVWHPDGIVGALQSAHDDLGPCARADDAGNLRRRLQDDGPGARLGGGERNACELDDDGQDHSGAQRIPCGYLVAFVAAVSGGSLRMILPAFMTNLTRCSSVMSASGSPDTATRSAYLPLSTDPSWFSHPITSALTTVPAWIARAGVRPPWRTSISKSSACAPGGYVEPSAPLPIMIFMPFVAAAICTAFSKMGIMRYLPPVLFASLSSMYGSV